MLLCYNTKRGGYFMKMWKSKSWQLEVTGVDGNVATKAAVLGAFQFSYDNNALTGLKDGKVIATPAPEKLEIGEANIVGWDISNDTPLACHR